ncbi:MAG: DNA-3-methyladenine glycosylase [Anaerolineae bacterium]|nr:DNA-3-methyladenine glycosylase [Anaerolineae bacterium]
MTILPRAFYDRPTLEVARDLLGCVLVRQLNGERLAGRIVEVEAYIGQDDGACHARFGRTGRNAVMFGPPGHAYIYFTYGMHWLLNVVTEGIGQPAAVLIRALEPLEGLARIAALRAGRPRQEWTSGPARLTRALAIDGTLNGVDLTTTGPLVIETGQTPPEAAIRTGPRVGIAYAPEPWRSRPWRFWLADSADVSKGR